jgi:hypothetical protein
MVKLTTRYLGVLTYAAVASFAIAKDLVSTVQELGILLAPIAAFISLDMYKHRTDKPSQ